MFFCLKRDFSSLVKLPPPKHKILKSFFNLWDEEKASIKLLNFGLKKVIITLGEKGLFYSDGNEDIYLKAKSIKAVDTTGAGDAFNGGLAYALSQNKSIKDALYLANQVAGLSTLKLGAGNSMPTLKDLS